jgi:eukaryotic-like serine/threonine-protein kinase
MSIEPGTILGRYEIRSAIGAGGMGEVYLAFDTQLDRLVALKILTAELAADQQGMGRFIQEAKAASALNHPNILTIYESGKTDITAFIATEFVDGVTLRQRMKQAPMKLSDILDVAIQVASALSVAHAAGIVHRDIKPENVMIRSDGYIKVLDFGLAKLTEAKRSDAAATTLMHTEPGVVMGTARYISPEQARGLEVDARTDIWSLGVMLYEMCAERPPFGGATNSDVLAAILEREPPPLARYSRDVPESLEWIVTKSLNKERDERYQTAKELLSDLRKVKRREDFDAEVERSTPPETESSAAVTAKSEPAPSATGSAKSASGTAGVATPTVSSAEYIVREVKRHKKIVTVAAAIAVLALAGIGFALYKIAARWESKPPPPRAMKIAKLTTTGNVTDAAIAPDGKYVVYATDDRGARTLWLKHLATGSNVPIIPPSSGWYKELSFSKDNNYIYYATSQQPGVEDYQLNQIPVLGGPPKKIASLSDRPEYTFSPDGSRIAFASSESDGNSLVTTKSDGTDKQKLASRKLPNWLIRPAWSPDGKTIACLVGTFEGDFYMNVVGISVANGKEEVLSPQKWPQIDRVTWLGDGSGLLLSAQEKVFSQVWELSYPGGQTRRITNDLNDYFGLMITSTDESLVTLQSDTSASVWIAEKGDAARATQLPFAGNRHVSSFDWTTDGRIVYESKSGEGADIWITGPNDATARQLTFGGLNRLPSVSPDNRHIVFMKGEGADNASHVWSMDLDGGNLRQLTKGVEEANPCVSSDGQWVVYKANVAGASALWKMHIDGGDPVRLTDHTSDFPAISPDGKFIACAYQTDANSQTKIALIPFAGGQPIKVFDIASAGTVPVRWTNDGRALTYVDARDGVSNIWIQPIDGSPPKQFTDFKLDSIFWFDWSRDGKQLALTRGNSTSDVVLMSNFRER